MNLNKKHAVVKCNDGPYLIPIDEFYKFITYYINHSIWMSSVKDCVTNGGSRMWVLTNKGELCWRRGSCVIDHLCLAVHKTYDELIDLMSKTIKSSCSFKKINLLISDHVVTPSASQINNGSKDGVADYYLENVLDKIYMTKLFVTSNGSYHLLFVASTPYNAVVESSSNERFNNTPGHYKHLSGSNEVIREQAIQQHSYRRGALATPFPTEETQGSDTVFDFQNVVLHTSNGCLTISSDDFRKMLLKVVQPSVWYEMYNELSKSSGCRAWVMNLDGTFSFYTTMTPTKCCEVVFNGHVYVRELCAHLHAIGVPYTDVKYIDYHKAVPDFALRMFAVELRYDEYGLKYEIEVTTPSTSPQAYHHDIANSLITMSNDLELVRYFGDISSMPEDHWYHDTIARELELADGLEISVNELQTMMGELVC